MRDFDWNSKERGVVLSAFFYGYITTQLMGGFMAPIVGAGRLYGLSSFFTGLLTLLIPWAARQGLWFLVATRAVQGVLQVLPRL